MAYILNTHLSPGLRVRRALSSFFGIGLYRSEQICDQLGLHHSLRVSHLSQAHIDQLTRILTKYYYTGSELQRAISKDVKRLVAIHCYRGFRHVQGLPVRGQRTHTNSRTVRKKRRI